MCSLNAPLINASLAPFPDIPRFSDFPGLPYWCMSWNAYFPGQSWPRRCRCRAEEDSPDSRQCVFAVKKSALVHQSNTLEQADYKTKSREIRKSPPAQGTGLFVWIKLTWIKWLEKKKSKSFAEDQIRTTHSKIDECKRDLDGRSRFVDIDKVLLFRNRNLFHWIFVFLQFQFFTFFIIYLSALLVPEYDNLATIINQHPDRRETMRYEIYAEVLQEHSILGRTLL